ncbi:hypothetical protein TNCV_1589881 [Trichonephila clavipes]|uniref:Uncharacterized protein n=1 Tax=Trichonephila clavipes TaxID=2585209 RepID=A0A8X6V3K6_TRICX|nr:hypothetical protein TNCV_1589881 [Trichonephila clavipes]
MDMSNMILYAEPKLVTPISTATVAKTLYVVISAIMVVMQTVGAAADFVVLFVRILVVPGVLNNSNLRLNKSGMAPPNWQQVEAVVCDRKHRRHHISLPSVLLPDRLA